jgi:hypothetical protein
MMARMREQRGSRQKAPMEHEGGEHEAEQEGAQKPGALHGSADGAVKRIAHAGANHDLGHFSHDNPPGHALAGRTQHLKPGDSLSFDVAGNQIYNVVDLIVDPPDGVVTVDKKLVKAMNHGQLGDSNDYRYTITMLPTAHAGQKAKVTTEASYQSRNDHNWAFHFNIVCG